MTAGSPAAAIVGAGVIGAGWAARFLLNGWNVVVFDPDPEAPRRLRAVLDNARRSLPALYDRPLPAEGALRWTATVADAVAGAAWAQESGPERLDAKHAILGAMGDAAPAGCVVASSTSGFTPTALTAAGARAIVAHPFNPVYLLPLVELVGEPTAVARAADILRGVGMRPLTLRREIDAHIADRLLEALWREALWLVRDGVATTGEIDEAIRMGFGLRWAQMGLFETYRIAGGEAGIAHFLAQFGPALRWPWSRLTDVPDLDEALVASIAAQSDEQSGHRDLRTLERTRDDNLVAILRALRDRGEAAGAVIAAHQTTLPAPPERDTLRRRTPAGWADAGGRLPPARLAQLFAEADAAAMAGRDAAPTRTTVVHHRPVAADAEISIRTAATPLPGGALRLRHRLFDDAGVAVEATHDMATRDRTPPD